MARGVSSPYRIYRIVHIDNLAGIIDEGGMWCGKEMGARELRYVQIGLRALTSHRKNREVPCGPGGNLCDYVPWHFCPRSIMLYQIHPGRSDYSGGQEPVLHFVTTVEKVASMSLPFVFTDRHAKTSYARFYDDIGDLEALDWEAIRSESLGRTEDDPDRPYRKEAEFLIHRFVPLGAILGVGVYSQRWKEDCDRLFGDAHIPMDVRVHPRWYF